jgi:hypothetical protein
MTDTTINGGVGRYSDQRPVAESATTGVAWPAVIAGAFASMALAVLLVTLASGLGLASVSPWANSGASRATVTVMTGVGLVVIHWLTSGLGGYLAGRLRTKWAGLHTHEVFFRDTANGFLTWAVAAVIGAVFVASAAAFIASGTAAVATDVVSGVARGAAKMASNSAGPSAYLLDRMFRTDHPAPAGGDADTKAQAGEIITTSLAAGKISAPDMTYLSQLIAARTGISPEDAGKRVDAAVADAKAAAFKAQQAADAARKAGEKLSLLTALAMLIGAFIASAAAALGGQQRDEQA